MSEPMGIAARIIAALSEFELPIAQGSMPMDADAYFTFTIDATPEDFGDDAPMADEIDVTLHLFAPFTRNTSRMRRKIRNAIFAAGFTYPEMVDASESTRSSDGTEQHIVFEFFEATGVDDDAF